jgi:hypothetical protein
MPATISNPKPEKITMPATVFPTVHMNGTSKRALIEDYAASARALHHAINLMAAAAPNGRDYYPQGAEAIRVAMREHQERIIKLQNIVRELEKIGEHIVDQEGGR